MTTTDYNKFWSLAFDDMEDVVFLVDKDFDVIRVNKRFIEFTGKKEKELIGKKCYSLVHGTGKPFAGCPHKKTLTTKMFEKGEFYEPRLEKWLSVSATPFFDDDHKLAGSIHIVADITERKREESEIQVLARFPSENPNPVLRIARDGTLLYVNEAGLRQLPEWHLQAGRKVPSLRDAVSEALNGGSARSLDIEHSGRLYSFFVTPVADAGYANLYALDITERRQAEEYIVKQNKFLKVILEALTHPFCVVDANDYSIIEANSAAGLADRSSGKATCYALTHKRDKPCAGDHLCPLSEVKRTKKSVTMEHVHYDKDGGERFVEVHAYPILDDAGNVVQMIEYGIDITERKEAEEALKESEARYKALFAGAAEGLIVADLKTKKFRHANPTVCRMFGYTEEEFTRLGVSDIHPKESLDHVMSEFKAQARGKKVLASELPCIRKDGTLFYADVSAALIVLDGHECNVGFFTDVTERKRAQDEIQAAKDYVDNIIKSMVDMLIVIGPDAKIRTINKAAVVLSGYKEDELIGEPVGILFAEEEEEEEEEATFKGTKFKKLLKKGFIAGYEMILTTKAGARVPVSFSGSVMKDRGGRLMGIVGIARDMREKREAEGALLELGERYRTVVENAADCVYLLDTKGRFIHANNKSLELFKIKEPESIVGKNFTDFVVARYKETVSKHVKKALTGETVQLHYETTMPKKKRRWWGATLVPLRDVKGRVTNILNISRDLTLERESKARIEFFREYAENVLANVPISVLVVNRAGDVVFANRNFIMKMRRTEKDVIGQNISEIMSSEIMVKAGWQAQIAEVLKTRDIVMGQKFEYRGKTFNYHMIPMREAVGRRHNVAIVIEDITERVALETQLQHSEKLAMMGQFTAGVAHEINNPLSIIKGNIQYLREQIKTGVDFHNKSDFRELKDTLVAVEQETVRCGDIITDLLHFAKKSGGKKKTRVDVNHVVRHVLHLMGRQLDLKGIKVERELKPHIAMVRGNHDLLQQVVMNLVINAEQAVTKRGTITIKTLQDAKKIYIVVRDNGRGIPKELMGFIFNPFFTTKNVEGGTGLGLSVAHAIVEDHNGTITVRSSPKKGSVFTITLPIAK